MTWGQTIMYMNEINVIREMFGSFGNAKEDLDNQEIIESLKGTGLILPKR